MTNIDDFINWWQGFRDAIDHANITKEHLDMIDRKINGLQDLWDISLPSREEEEYPVNPYDWPYIPPFSFPKITPTYPRTPDIWCRQDQQYPKVGTPLGFGTYQTSKTTNMLHDIN